LGRYVSILLGDGNGAFALTPLSPFATSGVTPVSLSVADFNRDGILDLAVANQSSNNASIYFGNGDGTFGAAVDYPIGASPYGVAVGDFNRDGKIDLAVANFNSPNVSVLLNAPLPAVDLNPTSLDFGNQVSVFQVLPKTLPVTNTGVRESSDQQYRHRWEPTLLILPSLAILHGRQPYSVQ